MTSAEQKFDEAIAVYQAGDLNAALEAAKALVADAPEFADGLNLAAAICQDMGRQKDAEAFVRRALEVDPINPIYLNTLGNGLLTQGRTDDAIEALERARRAMPDQPDILFNLGNALRTAGRFEEAVNAFRASLAVRPGYVPAYNNLAITLKAMGEAESAATALIEGLAFAPKSAELRFNLGNALQAAGRLNAAEGSYRRAVDLMPENADAWVNLGVVLAEQGQREEAEECFKKAIDLKPDLAPAYVGLADLADDGSLDAIAHRRSVLALNPDLPAIHSSLLMCLHYTAATGRGELAAEHRAFGEKFSKASPPAYRPDHDRMPDRPLKLGVVSGDFRFHAMRFFAQPVFAARDPAAWALTGYSTTARPDGETNVFRQSFDNWRDVRSLPADDLTDLIIRDEIDILIDLSGHAPHNRLSVFAAKPAPLQVAWGDYVDTRGLQAIDIIIGDDVHIPPQDEELYVEQVRRMPMDYICYQPPSYLPPVAPSPVEKAGCITFATFSELTKIQPETVALWASVLKAVPDARFLMNSYLLTDEARQGRLFSLFMEQGIGTDRLIIRTGGEHAEFLGQYSEADIILDTWPYSGGLTTCEALVMGVPVLTLTGDRFCGRHASAHLRAAGEPDLVAATQEELIAKAVALAGDADALAAARRGRRKRVLASPLCDVEAYAAAFYELLRSEWRALSVKS